MKNVSPADKYNKENKGPGVCLGQKSELSADFVTIAHVFVRLNQYNLVMLIIYT